MTQPPDWWSQLTPGIHNAPPRVPAPDPVAFTWQQLQQIVSGLVNEFLRQVAVALGAIEIFGFKPYEALVEIGENIAAAKANFDALLSGLSVGDIGGVLGYFGNLGVTGLYNAAAGFGNLSTSLLKNLTPTGGDIGQFDASALTGAINTALTFSGTALSTLLQYLNSAGQFSAAQLTGALNGAVTFGGTALSTVLQYLNSSGQFSAAQLTGALNGAVTLSGTTLSTLVTNINSSGQLLASGITGALGTGLTVGGVTLGTLFTNINSSGQLVLSGATGALNTAVTLGGTALSTLSTNWNGAVTNIANLLSGSGLANTTLVGSNLADIGTAITNAAAGTLGSLGAIASQVQTGFSDLITGVFNAFRGPSANAPVAAVGTTAAQSALESQISNLISAQTTLVALAPPVVTNMLNKLIDFSTYADASVLPSDFTIITWPGHSGGGWTGSGTVGIDGGKAVWVPPFPFDGPAAKWFHYNAASTTTDYQEVSGVWSGNGDNSSFIGLVARTNLSNTGVIWYCNPFGSGDQWSLEAIVGGVATAIAWDSSGDWEFKPGARYTLRAGTVNGVQRFQILENDVPLYGEQTGLPAPVTEFNDSGAVSQYGSSYRYGAGAMDSYGVAGNLAPAMKSLAVADGQSVIKPVSRYGYFRKLPSSGWSWVNQGGASVADSFDDVVLTAPSSTRNWRLRTRTLSPSSNYTATTYLDSAAAAAANTWWSGIGLRNSSSGSFIMFGPYGDATAGRLAVTRWTNATTFSANSSVPLVYQLPGGSIPNWLRIRDNRTNRYFEFSFNGIDWVTLFSEGRTTFITPDQFCFGANNEGTGADVVVRMRSLEGIG